MSHLQAGEIFEKRYQIVKHLGVGGMGAVYRAKQIDAANRDVAIKLISVTELEDPEMAKRMLRESKILSQLQHKNILTIFGISLDETNTPYMITEYIRGRSLREVIDQDGPMPWRRAVNLITQACAGISAAHKLGIVHRDLKPENLMLLDNRSEDDHLKIIDFGLSFSPEARMAESQRLTATGCLVGSSNYMSPEQITGQSDERSDIYALGCILFELISGEKLFDADTSVGVLYLQTNEDPWKRFAAIREAIPVALFKLLERVLAKSVNSRPQSAEIFADELQSITESPKECASGRQYMQTNERLINNSPRHPSARKKLQVNYRLAVPILIAAALLLPLCLSLLSPDQLVQKKIVSKKLVDDEELAQLIRNAHGSTYKIVFQHQIYKMTKGAKYNKYGYVFLRSADSVVWYLSNTLPMPYTAMNLATESEDIVRMKGLPPVKSSQRFDIPANADPLAEFWFVRLGRIICLKNLDAKMSINSMLDMLEDKDFGFAPDWVYTLALTDAVAGYDGKGPQEILDKYLRTGANSDTLCHLLVWRLLILNKVEEADQFFKKNLHDDLSWGQRLLRARINLRLGEKERSAAKEFLRKLIKDDLVNEVSSYELANVMLDAGMMSEILELSDYKNVFGTNSPIDTQQKSESLKKMVQLADGARTKLGIDSDDYLNASQRAAMQTAGNDEGAGVIKEGLSVLKNTRDPVERCRVMCFLTEHSSDWTNPVMQSYAFWLCKRQKRIMPRELQLRCAVLFAETNQYSLRQNECLAVLQNAVDDIEKNGYPPHTDYGTRIDEHFAARARVVMFEILCRLQDKSNAKKVLDEMISKNQAHYCLDQLYAADPIMIAPYLNSQLSKIRNVKSFLPICIECLRSGKRDLARSVVLAWKRFLIERGTPKASDQNVLNMVMTALIEFEFNDYLQAKTILLQIKGDNKEISKGTKERLDLAREMVMNR